MMDLNLALITGIDIPIPQLQLVMHQPRIKEIAYMGEDDFFQAAQHICIQKELLTSDETVLSNLTNFQVLMKVIEQQQTSEKKIALITLLSLLFPDYQAVFTPNSILLRNAETKETKMIDKDNFQFLQEIVRTTLCLQNLLGGNNVVYNPANKKAQEIANKIMEGRRKIAKMKNEDSKKESIISRYISILTIGNNSMTLDDYCNCTIYQLFDLIERYNLWLDWNIDLRVRLTGTKPKKEVDNWMKSIHSIS